GPLDTCSRSKRPQPPARPVPPSRRTFANVSTVVHGGSSVTGALRIGQAPARHSDTRIRGHLSVYCPSNVREAEHGAEMLRRATDLEECRGNRPEEEVVHHPFVLLRESCDGVREGEHDVGVPTGSSSRSSSPTSLFRVHHSDRSKARRPATATNRSTCCPMSAQTRFIASVTSSGA